MSHRRPQQGPLAPHPGSGLEQSTCLTAAQGVRLLRSSPQSVGWGEPDADERRAEFPEAALASAGQEEAEGERRVGPVWNQLSHRPCLCREWGPRSPSPTFPCSASLFSRSVHPVASFPCLGFFPLGNLLPPRALLRPPYLKRLQSGRPQSTRIRPPGMPGHPRVPRGGPDTLAWRKIRREHLRLTGRGNATTGTEGAPPSGSVSLRRTRQTRPRQAEGRSPLVPGPDSFRSPSGTCRLVPLDSRPRKAP